MQEENKKLALEYAKKQFPKEACGLLVVECGREVFIPCGNLAKEMGSFILDPVDYAFAELRGEIVGVVHSHCLTNEKPSQIDLVSCEKHGIPWHIVSIPNEAWYSFEPSGYRAPLVGRQFNYGTLDCYTLVQDYYKEVLGIELMNFERSDEDAFKKGHSLYVENSARAGFEQVSDLREHDVVLMQINARAPNHAAIFVGNNLILHHMTGRLSSRDVYGEYYRKRTRVIYRYKK